MKNSSKKAQKMDKIMGINVISSSTTEVLTRVKDLISHNSKFYIVTPNPEIILASINNLELKKALNEAHLSIPDGVGLKVANPSLKIIKGRELFIELIKLSVKEGWKVFLLGGLDNEAYLAKEKLKNMFQVDEGKLIIESSAGPRLDNFGKPIARKDVEVEKKTIEMINNFSPTLLFVAFGNPKQEIWVHEHLSELKISGTMCVGGTFRYIAGNSSLPPKWLANIGLEWLWRVFTEPKRIGRILRAVIVFPIRVFLNKFSNK